MYAEDLPHQCPPQDAIEAELDVVYRLVANAVPNSDDFASKAARGEPCDDTALQCAWASCSLFKKARSLSKYTRIREEYPYLATLRIPADAGRFKGGESKRGHVDFWRYAGKCLSAYVVSVEGPSNA
jgi:hypothetical protein